MYKPVQENQTVASQACESHVTPIVNYNTMGLYTIVHECEHRIVQEGVDFTRVLHKQSLSIFHTSIIKALLNKFKPIAERYKLDLENVLLTILWLLGRLKKVEDFSDVFSMLDYITRIHMNAPAAQVLIDFVFGSSNEAQSMDWTALRSVLTSYEALKNHPAVVKFIKLISLAFSGGVFATFGIDCQMAALWKVTNESMSRILGHTDFLAALIDLGSYVAERVSAFLITGNWHSLFYTPTHFSAWADEAASILEKSTCAGNLSALGVDFHKYLADLDKCIKTGDEIRRYLKAGDSRDTVGALLTRLRTFQNEILVKQGCGKPREAPFTFLIYGGSGVAKSSFTQVCVTHYALSYDKPLGDEYMYYRSAKETHWNSYNTSKWCTIMDDIASINPAKGSDDPSLDEILGCVNNAAYMTNQAAIEDKGKVPFLGELLLATTNEEKLKAHIWFNNPQAIRRRFNYVLTLLPKEEFRLDGSNMLDKEKAAQYDLGDYPNLWEIQIKKLTVDKEEQIVENIIHVMNDIYDFCNWYNWAVDQHKYEQKSFLASVQRSRTTDFCKIHRLPRSRCACPTTVTIEPQGSVLGTVVAASLTYTASEVAANTVRAALGANPTLIDRPAALIEAAAQVAQTQIVNTVDYYRPKNICKRVLKQAADEAYQTILEYVNPNIKIILGVSAAIAAVGITWKMLSKEIPEMTGLEPQTVEGVGIIPAGKDEVENVWRKDDYVPSEFIDRLSESWASLPTTQVASLVGKNVVWCQTSHGVDGKHHIRFRAVCLGGHLYATTSHCLPMDEYFTLQVIHEKPTEGCNGNISFKMSQKCILRPENNELAFFEINHMPVRRDIRGLFPKYGVKLNAPGVIVSRNADGSLDYNHTSRTANIYDQPVEAFNLKLHIGHSTVTTDTVDGQCGSPVVCFMPNGAVIAGLHVLGGRDKRGVSVMLFQEQIDDAIAHFDTPIIDSIKPDLEGVDFTTEVSPKCTARFIQSGTLEVYGSFTGFKRQPKSSGIPTCMAPALQSRGWKMNVGPAPMKGYRPVRLALLPMVQKPLLFEEDKLAYCMEVFASETISNLPHEDLAELEHIYALEVALNGVPGLRYVDSMNFGTSSGFPYNKSKSHYITRLPSDDIWQHPVQIDESIRADVDRIWARMKTGQRSGIVFMQHIKDEILPMSKVEAGKARIFMGGPFGWSICVRMALLPFIRIMQRNKYIFESAPGTNATSIEWSRLYQYLSQYGADRAIAGDFKAFDKGMGALVIKLAFHYIRKILKRAGATEEHLLIVQSISEDVAFAFCNYNGDFMQFYGSNPSGHPLTVIINCIVNCLYMRYCYYQVNPNRTCVDFRENVRLMTYGDDNIMCSRVDWFNHTVIAEQLDKVGITYTMADKVSESVPFLPLSKTSFLKRSFEWNSELGAHMAVLEEDSIKKSLMMCIPSKTESHQKQCIDIVRSAVSEYFFYGKEKYEEMVVFLRSLVEDSNLTPYVEDNTFLSWEEHKARFIKSSEDYLDNEPKSTIHLLGEMKWPEKRV